MTALVRPDAGALDVAADADADAAALGRRPRLRLREGVPADQLLEHAQGLGVVAAVVDQRAPVLECQALVVGELVRLDEVGRPDLRTVPAEIGGDLVHRALHAEHALRAARAPVRRDLHGVGVDRGELDPVGAHLVRPQQLGRGDDRHDDPVRRVGAVVVQDLHLQAEEAAVVVEAHPHVLHLPALVGGGDEVLAPVLGPLDLPVQQPGRPGDEDLLGPGMDDLDAEAAADVGRDDLHLGQRQSQLGRDRHPHAGGGLRGGVDAQRRVVGVPAGVHALPLQGRARAAFHIEAELQPVRGRVDRLPRRLAPGAGHLLHEVRADVARHVVVDQVRAPGGLLQAHDRLEHLVVDPDQRAGVLGEVAVAGDDHDDRLPDVPHDLPGQRVRRAAVGERRVRDQQRQRLGQRAGQVLPRVDRDQAVHVEGGRHVDVEDPRVGVRRPDEGGGRRARAQVVEETPPPGDQPGSSRRRTGSPNSLVVMPRPPPPGSPPRGGRP